MDALGVELCEQHFKRIEKLIEQHDTPLEAIQLYYGLKESGVNAMLEWWDGKKIGRYRHFTGKAQYRNRHEVPHAYTRTGHKRS